MYYMNGYHLDEHLIAWKSHVIDIASTSPNTEAEKLGRIISASPRHVRSSHAWASQ